VQRDDLLYLTVKFLVCLWGGCDLESEDCRFPSEGTEHLLRGMSVPIENIQVCLNLRSNICFFVLP
jgi:hypothetical protein